MASPGTEVDPLAKIGAMRSFETDRFKRPISEVAVWCAARCPGAVCSDGGSVSRRRELLQKRAQLLEEADRIAGRRLFHGGITRTKQWQEAEELLHQVWDSLGFLNQTLRSTELKPDTHFDSFSDDTAWEAAVEQVITKRSLLVAESGPVEGIFQPVDGRILLYWPAENLACGAAEVASKGFFDVDNVPPWDIWVGFASRALISWVPPVLIEAVQMGIDANPEQCIQWADQ